MGKIVRTKIQGLSLAVKASLITVFTLLLTIGLYQGWQKTSYAAPVAASSWTLAYGNGSYPAGNTSNLGTLTIPTGSNRLLVVAIASTSTAASARTIVAPAVGNLTAGTMTTMTLGSGDMTSATTWNHTALYYMTESQLAALTANTLTLELSGGTSSYNWVYYRVYNGVDQTTPLSSTANFNDALGNSTIGPFNPTLIVGTNDTAIEVLNLSSSTATGTTLRTITGWSNGWSQAVGNQTTRAPASQMYLADYNSAIGNATSYHTLSGNAYDSMTAISMKGVSPPTLTVNGNQVVASGSRLDTDAGVMMQRVTAAGNSTMELTSVVLNNIGTANAIAKAEIWISPTSATIMPVDAVLVGSATSLGSGSTTITLNTGTALNRTLGGTGGGEPSVKYLYVVYDMSPGQSTKTVQSSITSVVASTASATGLALNSNIITIAYSGNQIDTTALVTGATAAKDSDFAVVMMHFKVDTSTLFDSTVELNSLTLQELGSTTQVSTVKVYISTTEEADFTKLPATAVQIGQISDWTKATTTIPLTNDYGATTNDRTVISSLAPALGGAAKYIYVVYGMYYPDDADVVWPNGTVVTKNMTGVQTATTVQAKVTGLGANSPDISLSSLAYLSNTITLTRGTWSKITSCGGCHATEKLVDGTNGRDTTTGLFPGSHEPHNNKNGFDCSNCHVKPTIYKHANGYINFSGHVYGDKYSKSVGNKLKVTNKGYAGIPADYGTCSATTCHGDSSPTWGTTSTDDTCVKCHGVKGVTHDQYSTAKNANYAAPGYNGTGTATNGTITAPAVGAHDTHLRGLNNITSPIACNECHTVPTKASDIGHIDSELPAEVPMNGTLARMNSAVPAYDPASHTCTNVYCHYGKSSYSPAATNAAVVWTESTYLNGTTADCQKCHASPPNNTGNHASKTLPGGCTECHDHVALDGTISNLSKHINGALDASGGHAFPYGGLLHKPGGTGSVKANSISPFTNCNGCHNSGINAYPTLAAVGARKPLCTVCHINSANFLNTVSGPGCWDCHGSSPTDGMPNGAAFPNKALSHSKHVVGVGMVCADCHTGGGNGTANHGNSNNVVRTIADVTVASPSAKFTFAWAGGTGLNPQCSSVACHGTAEWGVTTFDCVSCHISALPITKGPLAGTRNRAAVAASFLPNQNSHKFSSTFTQVVNGTTVNVNKYDCCVCHMEGNTADGTSNGTYHQNGYVDLRDPDSGAPVNTVTWNNSTTSPGSFTENLNTPLQMSGFSRNLATTLEADPDFLNIAAVEINFCLKCHDSGGATSTLAQVPAVSGATGSAGRPFGYAIGSTSTYYLNNVAAGNTSRNLVDVASSFVTTNASYHPVTGKNNNGFAYGTTRMRAPWDGSINPIAGKTGGAGGTVYGYLISCFDCHNTTNATGTVLSTAVAHGNGSTSSLRRPNQHVASGNSTSVVQSNICTLCHALDYGNGSSSNHQPVASAYGSGGSSMSGTMPRCGYCHSSGAGVGGYETSYTGLNAQDAHGFNNLTNGGALNWPSGTRPYAFMRAYGTTAIGAGYSNWTMGTCTQNTSTTQCNNSFGSYTPGGVY